MTARGAASDATGQPHAGRRPSAPELVRPTVAVRDSYLAGMREMCAAEGTSAAWLDEAEADFAALVAERSAERELWGVPATELWYVRGREYIGTVMIRHALTPALRSEGGHVGYHVVPRCRRQGHATAMLAAACARCRDLGLSEILVTCAPDNAASRRVIEANGGVPQEPADGTQGTASPLGGICRYRIAL